MFFHLYKCNFLTTPLRYILSTVGFYLVEICSCFSFYKKKSEIQNRIPQLGFSQNFSKVSGRISEEFSKLRKPGY